MNKIKLTEKEKIYIDIFLQSVYFYKAEHKFKSRLIFLKKNINWSSGISCLHIAIKNNIEDYKINGHM